MRIESSGTALLAFQWIYRAIENEKNGMWTEAKITWLLAFNAPQNHIPSMFNSVDLCLFFDMTHFNPSAIFGRRVFICNILVQLTSQTGFASRLIDNRSQQSWNRPFFEQRLPLLAINRESWPTDILWVIVGNQSTTVWNDCLRLRIVGFSSDSDNFYVLSLYQNKDLSLVGKMLHWRQNSLPLGVIEPIINRNW